MCHSATARPTYGVVVDRAVFVTWNPPATTRSRTRTGFVFCFSHFAVPCVMCYNSSVRCPRRSPRRPLPELSSPARGVAARFAHLAGFASARQSPQGRPPIAFASEHQAVVRRPRRIAPLWPAKLFLRVPSIGRCQGGPLF